MPVTRRGFLGLSAAFSLGGAECLKSPQEFEIDRFFIAGFRFHEGPHLIGRMWPGDGLEVCAEPQNSFDPGAVRLEFLGRHIGYVPQSRNAVIGRLLAQRAPLYGRIVSIDPAADPWRAIEIAVVLPTMIRG